MLLSLLFSLLSLDDDTQKNRKLTAKEKQKLERMAWEMSEEFEDD